MNAAFDVVVIGSALTGAAAAVRLLRLRPETRVMLVEARARFGDRHGYASGPVGSLFLTRGLRLSDHLARHHLPSFGTRFWYHNDEVVNVQGASEFGPRFQPDAPCFLLDEDVLAEHLLAEAAELGATVLRPVRVVSVEPRPYATVVGIETADGTKELTARWVLDASGRAAVMGRKLALAHPIREHPIASFRCLWRGDLDLDGPRFLPETEFARSVLVARRLSPNSFVGYGWQVQLLPLGDGALTVTLSFDKRVLDLHRDPDPGDAYTRFLSGLPALRQLLRPAEMQRSDLRVLPQVAWSVDQSMGPGWALLGGASGCLDPSSEHPLNHGAATVEGAVAIVCQQLDGKPVTRAIDAFDAALLRSFRRCLAAMHRDRYLLHGDFATHTALLLLERNLLAMFDQGPRLRGALRPHGFQLGGGGPGAAVLASLLARLSRRAVRIARARMRGGLYGSANHGKRLLARGDVDVSALFGLLGGALRFSARELERIGLLATPMLALLGREEPPQEPVDSLTLPDGVALVGDPDATFDDAADRSG